LADTKNSALRTAQPCPRGKESFNWIDFMSIFAFSSAYMYEYISVIGFRFSVVKLYARYKMDHLRSLYVFSLRLFSAQLNYLINIYALATS